MSDGSLLGHTSNFGGSPIEYIGKEWFEEITQRNMHFCIRLRKNALALTGNKRVKLFQLFDTRFLRILRKSRRVHGCELYLAGQRLGNGDFFIVGSATKTRALAQIYAKRWQRGRPAVETLFACFKSRGFNIEECRVNHSRRIKTLIFLLALTATWAVRVGNWLIQQGKSIPIKKFKDRSSQRWKSVFRWGLDHLQTLILNNLDYHYVMEFYTV